MKFINNSYEVEFHDFSLKNFRKNFLKKYKKRYWEATEKSIEDALERIYNLAGTKTIDTICPCVENSMLVKYDFQIAGTTPSAKASGNRCILKVDNTNLKVLILLVYCKNDITPAGKHETTWWKEKIKDNLSISCI